MAEGDVSTVISQDTSVSTAASTAWHAGLDEPFRKYITDRGLADKDPVQAFLNAAQAHQAAQALLGVPAERIVKLPTDASDAVGWRDVYKALGAPDDANGYDFSALKFTDGTELDPEFVAFAKSQAAALHLSPTAAAQMAASYVKFVEDNDAAAEAARTAAITEKRQALQTKWGPNFDSNLAIAKNTAASLGVSEEAVNALEAQIGYDAVMDMFRNIGTKIGEPAFIMAPPAGGGDPTLARTAGDAQVQLNELKADTEWVQRFLGGDAKARKQHDYLTELIVGVHA